MASEAAAAFCGRLDEIYGVLPRLSASPSEAGAAHFICESARWLQAAADCCPDFSATHAMHEWRDQAHRLARVAQCAVTVFGFASAEPGAPGDQTWKAPPPVDESAAVGRAAADCLHAWAGDDRAKVLNEAQRALTS